MAILPVLALAAVCAQAPTGEEIARNLSARAAQDAASTFRAEYRKEWREQTSDDTAPFDPKIKESDLKGEPLPRQELEWHTIKQRDWHLSGNGYRFSQILIEDTTGEHAPGYTEEKVSDARRAFLARYSFESDTACIPEDGLLSVSFTPRTDVSLPSGEKEDELLNRLSGKMFIDTRTWYVRAAIGYLTQPFRVQLIGKVLYARVMMLQDDTDGVVILRVISTEIWADPDLWPFEKKRYHLRQIYEILNETEAAPRVSPR